MQATGMASASSQKTWRAMVKSRAGSIQSAIPAVRRPAEGRKRSGAARKPLRSPTVDSRLPVAHEFDDLNGQLPATSSTAIAPRECFGPAVGGMAVHAVLLRHVVMGGVRGR